MGIEHQPGSQETDWEQPFRKLRIARQSVLALRSMKVGETKRINHSDIFCEGKQCAFRSWLSKLRKQRGWELESYHEQQYIIVVRRLK